MFRQLNKSFPYWIVVNVFNLLLYPLITLQSIRIEIIRPNFAFLMRTPFRGSAEQFQEYLSSISLEQGSDAPRGELPEIAHDVR
jgi:hypothetical protein